MGLLIAGTYRCFPNHAFLLFDFRQFPGATPERCTIPHVSRQAWLQLIQSPAYLINPQSNGEQTFQLLPQFLAVWHSITSIRPTSALAESTATSTPNVNSIPIIESPSISALVCTEPYTAGGIVLWDGYRGIFMTVAFSRPATSASASAYAVGSESSSDETLIKRIASGHKLALQALFARYHVRIYRFVLRIVRDETMAEDLISDVFLDVWRQAARFEARASVSTWLLAIAKYKAHSMLRRRTEDQLDCEMAVTIADPADNPEIALQKKNSGEVLRQCIAGLSPEHGQIIDLVYYHGKSVKEVALIVGIPEATVKTRMFYARRRLADQIKAA